MNVTKYIYSFSHKVGSLSNYYLLHYKQNMSGHYYVGLL